MWWQYIALLLLLRSKCRCYRWLSICKSRPNFLADFSAHYGCRFPQRILSLNLFIVHVRVLLYLHYFALWLVLLRLWITIGVISHLLGMWRSVLHLLRTSAFLSQWLGLMLLIRRGTGGDAIHSILHLLFHFFFNLVLHAHVIRVQDVHSFKV